MAMYDMVIPIFSAGCTFVIVLNQFSNLPTPAAAKATMPARMAVLDVFTRSNIRRENGQPHKKLKSGIKTDY